MSVKSSFEVCCKKEKENWSLDTISTYNSHESSIPSPASHPFVQLRILRICVLSSRGRSQSGFEFMVIVLVNMRDRV
jgi:hypothetical protein